MAAGDSRRIVVGKVTGVYGVKGWVRLYSFTAPRENILSYKTFVFEHPMGNRTLTLRDGRAQGKGVVAAFEGIDDRELARTLMGGELSVTRETLPKLGKDEFYWADLEGLRVATEQGVELGVVDHLFETGANDVMVVQGADKQHLVPFVQGPFVKKVDLAEGLVVVDWDPDF